jgi:hypothetical protein
MSSKRCRYDDVRYKWAWSFALKRTPAFASRGGTEEKYESCQCFWGPTATALSFRCFHAPSNGVGAGEGDAKVQQMDCHSHAL